VKYALLGLIVVMVIAFYVMNQSNKADAERLKQAEIAHQQKLKQDKANEERLAAESKQRLLEAEQAKSMKAEQEHVKNEAQAKEFAQKAEAEKVAVIKKAEDGVKSRLIDPDSAKFRNQKGNCGEVNAKNKLGGYTGYSRYIYDPKEDHAVVESDASTSIITPDIMNALWSGSCS
jgi:membrane protein involved in colicin uptake